ncbi:MAG: hypothetical protein BWZ10_02684 [candidate division BRC1 bacterium ADurb.BinA364]|nr:MAG: hypothetical protein BWZ10_02684 [candidate division BRC1 bacterium ADurb.BinA364]
MQRDAQGGRFEYDGHADRRSGAAQMPSVGAANRRGERGGGWAAEQAGQAENDGAPVVDDAGGELHRRHHARHADSAEEQAGGEVEDQPAAVEPPRDRLQADGQSHEQGDIVHQVKNHSTSSPACIRSWRLPPN